MTRLFGSTNGKYGLFEISDDQKGKIQMPAALADSWIEALRSGKYIQGKEALAELTKDGNINGYCCLGVLEMVVDGQVEFQRTSVGRNEPRVTPSSEWLRKNDVRFWQNCLGQQGFTDRAGNPNDNPQFYIRVPDTFSPIRVSIAELNDRGYTFDEIADIIEFLIKRL
jgi:hypothetical protein